MKNTLLAVLAAVCLCAGSGCCRCWFKWPGHYEHNPSFSQCCETPWKWGPDRFAERGARPGRAWGNGAVKGECHYDGRLGLFPLFKKHRGQECAEHCGCGDEPGDCGCGDAGYGPGYPARGHAGAGRPYPGMPGMPPMGYPGMPPMAYGPGGMPLSPEGIPLQPAPDAMSAAQVAYPYYTTRGPRDFFLGYPPGSQPPSIGP